MPALPAPETRNGIPQLPIQPGARYQTAILWLWRLPTEGNWRLRPPRNSGCGSRRRIWNSSDSIAEQCIRCLRSLWKI